MESPWHWGSGVLLKESLVAARGGTMVDYYIGVNMFVYYSWQQVRNQDFKGPDVYFVHDVDGQKARLYWAIWDEDGRYPDIVFEFLSQSTEREDLSNKRRIYEERFRVKEYFCMAPQMERLFGWHSSDQGYVPIPQDERGWLWSASLNLWIGAWKGVYMVEDHTWPRLYFPDGRMVPTSAERAEAAQVQAEAEHERAEAAQVQAEAERERAEAAQVQADAERERAEALAARVAQLEEELKRLQDK